MAVDEPEEGGREQDRGPRGDARGKARLDDAAKEQLFDEGDEHDQGHERQQEWDRGIAAVRDGVRGLHRRVEPRREMRVRHRGDHVDEVDRRDREEGEPSEVAAIRPR